MIRERVSGLLHEGQRFKLSTSLWRNASATSKSCDVVIRLEGGDKRCEEKRRRCADSLVVMVSSTIYEVPDTNYFKLRRLEPLLAVEIVHHQLDNSFALYVTTDYVTFLKGAELCRLKKKRMKQYGGGLVHFTQQDASRFVNIEEPDEFLSSLERATIIKKMLDLIRAPVDGYLIEVEENEQLTIPDGASVLSFLKRAGVIREVLPLHEQAKLKELTSAWVVSLHSQPLDDVRGYFGCEIALYFAWLSHMTSALVFPAFLGIFLFIYGSADSDGDHSEASNYEQQFSCDICFVTFALFNCLWATAYLEHWKRYQAELTFKWGTFSESFIGEAFLEEPRASFKGEGYAENPVTGLMEPFFPRWKKALIRYGITFPITFSCISVLFSMMLFTFRVQHWMDQTLSTSAWLGWLCYFPMIAFTLFLQCSEKAYRKLALYLNEIENYRSEEDYEKALISKVVVFQFVSAFGTLFYTAFVLQDMKKLREILATLLITRQFTQNLSESILPYFMERVKFSRMTYEMTRSMSEKSLHQLVCEKRSRIESICEQRNKKGLTFESDERCGEEQVLRNRQTGETFAVGSADTAKETKDYKIVELSNQCSASLTLPNRSTLLNDSVASVSLPNHSTAPLTFVIDSTTPFSPPADSTTPFSPSADSTTLFSPSPDKTGSITLLKDSPPAFTLPNDPALQCNVAVDISQAELECNLKLYDRPLDDYLEIVIQFGYVLLFSPSFPLAALFALLNNILEMRVDAFKLCNNVQRPFGRFVKDIGAWQGAMEAIGTLGVIVNCLLIGQSGLLQRMWPGLSWTSQVAFIVLLEHILLGARRVIDWAVPDVPEWVRVQLAREELNRQMWLRSSKASSTYSTLDVSRYSSRARSLTPLRNRVMNKKTKMNMEN